MKKDDENMEDEDDEDDKDEDDENDEDEDEEDEDEDDEDDDEKDKEINTKKNMDNLIQKTETAIDKWISGFEKHPLKMGLKTLIVLYLLKVVYNWIKNA